jgi:hypothetical protein
MEKIVTQNRIYIKYLLQEPLRRLVKYWTRFVSRFIGRMLAANPLWLHSFTSGRFK